jgi:Kef-type K+ transport system membrane component KefB
MSFEHFLPQIIIIIVAAKLGAELAHRLGQPAVLGELLAGVMVGGSVLGWVEADNEVLHIFAELGAVLLLFEVGLECDLTQLLRIGGAALYVACAGVALPFALGYGMAALLGQEQAVAIFVGAALTATSVGITARVFSDMNRLQTKEAQIVLGAAVADDIIGLIILAVVSGLAKHKTVQVMEIAQISVVSVAFLTITLVIGVRAAPLLLRVMERARTRGVLVSGIVSLCFFVSMLSAKIRLAPIVGAFAAGLLLARTEEPEQLQTRIRPIAELLIPVFFVIMGARINLSTVNVTTGEGRATLLLGGLLLLAAIVGKVFGCGSLPAEGFNRALIGFGMVPRGEVGLIFADRGLKGHVLTDNLYTAILMMVMGTTLLTPPLLKWLIERSPKAAPATEEVELAEAPQDVL